MQGGRGGEGRRGRRGGEGRGGGVQKFSKHNFILLHLRTSKYCNQVSAPVQPKLLSDTEAVMCAGALRERRAAPRRRRQAPGAGGEEDVGAEFNPENPYQVSHTRRFFFCCFQVPLQPLDCRLGSEREAGGGAPEKAFLRRAPHSCASGSRCRGHGGGARIVTADLSACVGVFSVLCLSKAFLSPVRLYE